MGYSYLQQHANMNKALLCSSLFLLLVCLSQTAEAKEKSAFLTDLCEKCDYCKEDPTCIGCQHCSTCENRKQDGCRFCRKNENVDQCKERCRKGCKICAGKEGNGLESCN